MKKPKYIFDPSVYHNDGLYGKDTSSQNKKKLGGQIKDDIVPHDPESKVKADQVKEEVKNMLDAEMEYIFEKNRETQAMYLRRRTTIGTKQSRDPL